MNAARMTPRTVVALNDVAVGIVEVADTGVRRAEAARVVVMADKRHDTNQNDDHDRPLHGTNIGTNARSLEEPIALAGL